MKNTLRSFTNPLFWAATAAAIILVTAPDKQDAPIKKIAASEVILP